MRLVRGAGGVRILAREESVARQRATAIVAMAEANAVAIRAQARDEGAAEGRADAVALLVAAQAEIARERNTYEDSVAEIARAVAAVVLGREAEGGLSVVRDVTVSVLSRVRRAKVVLLKVSPEEADSVRTQVEAWLPKGMAPEVVAVEADAAITRGGVIAETDIGRVDGRLETQLDAIARALAADVRKIPE